MSRMLLLNLEAAAAELAVSELAILRLIAKKLLPATKVGVNADGNEWRIDPTALAAYVRAGVKDLRMPEIDGPWFTRRWDALAAACQTALDSAAQPQRLQPAEAQLLFDRQPREVRLLDKVSLDLQLAFSPAMQAIFRQPVPVSGCWTTKPSSQSTFKSWGTLFLTSGLWATAWQMLSRRLRAEPRLTQLYDPETFDATLREIVASFGMKRCVIITSLFNLRDGFGRVVPVTFTQMLSNAMLPGIPAAAVAAF